MADTGFSGDMAVSTEGADVEIDALIKAVVERGSRRKDALSRRFDGNGPQLLGSGASPDRTPEIRPQDEINGLLDDIRRDASARTTQADVPAPQDQQESKPWLADAVMAQTEAEAKGYRAFGDPDDVAEEAEDPRGFGINPFGRKAATLAAAAAIPAAGAMALGRSDDEGQDEEIEPATHMADPEATAQTVTAPDEIETAPEIGGDAFARDLVAHEAETRVAHRDLEAFDDEQSSSIEADERPDDDGYAAALLAEEPEALAPLPVAAMQAQAVASGGNDGGGVPVWLTMGIPVAAVSMAALVAGVHVVRETGAEDVPIEAASLAPMTVTYADAGEPPVANSVGPTGNQADGEAIILANAPIADGAAPGTGVDQMMSDAVPALPPAAAPEMPAPEISAPVNDAPAEIIEVSAPVPRTVNEPEPEIAVLPDPDVPFAPSLKPDQPNTRSARIDPVPAARSSAPERARTSNVPSLKPQLASLPRRARTAEASDAVFRPRTGTVPARVFDGHFERGSAALLVNAVAADMGGPLNRTQQSWLARDMERVLDRELDGRDVSLKSDRGDRIGVLFADSAQELRRMPVARERGVAALPDQMVLEGGWYAARTDAALRPTPSLFGTFRNRIVEKDTLIERMATVTDRYGDRWYLMGQRGVAIGYMSPAELVLAEATTGALGLPLERRLGDVVQDMVPVFTRCRTVYIGPLGESRQKMSVCRNAKGNWVGADHGQVSLQHASAPRPEPIVLASAAGQSPELRPFETAAVRKSLTPKLVYGRAGQVIKQHLPDGRDVEMTLGAKFETTQTVPVMRLEALGRIDRPVRLDARWMRVPGEARLRATPDYLTEMSIGTLPTGSAIETIGSVVNDRGEEWVLVGRRGVGFGYVQRQELMPLAGSTALQALPSRHSAAVVDMVETVTECRSIDYLGAGLDGTFTACQQPDGQWALSAEPALRQLVDLEPSSRTAP